MDLMIRDENDWGGFRNCGVGDEGWFYRVVIRERNGRSQPRI